MRLIPSKRVREKFYLIYELEGAQRAVNFLSKHYKVKRMKVIVDGRRVGKNCIAYYLKNEAYFKKHSLRKRVVLHEFFHHLVSNARVMPVNEEREANEYAKVISKRQ